MTRITVWIMQSPPGLSHIASLDSQQRYWLVALQRPTACTIPSFQLQCPRLIELKLAQHRWHTHRGHSWHQSQPLRMLLQFYLFRAWVDLQYWHTTKWSIPSNQVTDHGPVWQSSMHRRLVNHKWIRSAEALSTRFSDCSGKDAIISFDTHEFILL